MAAVHLWGSNVMSPDGGLCRISPSGFAPEFAPSMGHLPLLMLKLILAPQPDTLYLVFGEIVIFLTVFELIRSFSIRMSTQYTLHSGEARQA